MKISLPSLFALSSLFGRAQKPEKPARQQSSIIKSPPLPPEVIEDHRRRQNEKKLRRLQNKAARAVRKAQRRQR